MVEQILPRTVWPISLLLFCVALEAGVLRLGIDDLDEGYFVQQATRVLHGQVPFRDFETLYAPGLAYLHAWVFALFEGPSLLAARGLALAARAGLVLMLFFMTRPLVRNPWWAVLPGLVILLGVDDAPVRWEPHPGWLSTLFAVLAAWCISRRWLVAAGVAAAGAYVFKQNTGVYLLGAILVWTAWTLRSRRALLSLGAFAAVSLAWLIPLLFALGGHYEGVGVLVGAVNQSSLLSPPEPTIAIAIAALVGGVWLVRHDSNPVLGWYLLAACALFLTEFPRMDTLHLAWSMPLLLVLGAAALSRLPRWITLVSLALTIALVWPTLSSRAASLSLDYVPLAGVEAPSQTADDILSTVDDIRQRTRPNEPIFVYPTSPLLYVLADRPNVTRFDHLNPGAASPAQIDDVIADLQRGNVRLVVVSDFWESVWGDPGSNKVLEDWIAAHTTEVGRHGAYRVLQVSL